jgi:hypothetical protein
MSQFRAARNGDIVLPHTAMIDDLGESGSDGTSESDSSVREYAEGLGCADRKACRGRTGGQFEFDEHPREEYFEEPRSHRGDEEEFSAPEVLAPRSKRLRQINAATESHGSRSLQDMFDRLEREETQTSPPDRSEAVRRKLGVVSRRCTRRAEIRNSNVDRCGKPPCAAMALPLENSLKSLCRELSQLRSRESISAVGYDRILRVLKQLGEQHINVVALQSTGVGLEVNQRYWRQHPCAEIAAQSSALVRRWRGLVRPELRQLSLREGGA